jgi:integrase
VAWQKGRIDAAGDDPRSIRSAKTSCNSYLRQARSLFGKKIIGHLREIIDLPAEIPLLSVPLIPVKSARYVSRIDAEIVLQRAIEELGPEPLKIIMLGLCAGLRAGEIDGLRWSAIDLDKGEILIDSTETFEAKSASSVGTVEIDPGLVELLQGWKAKRAGVYVVATDSKPRGWAGERRAKAAFDAAYEWLRGLEIDGEMPLAEAKMPLHTLRKEAGSIINQRYGLAAASMFLRHASIGITASTYVAKMERHTVGLLSVPPANVIDLDPAKKEGTNG